MNEASSGDHGDDHQRGATLNETRPESATLERASLDGATLLQVNGHAMRAHGCETPNIITVG